MTRKDLEKMFYLIAKYWLGELQGFIKIGDDKNENNILVESEKIYFIEELI